MRRILVTGAHGFLGRHTAAVFKQDGCEVIGIGHGHWGFEKPGDFGIDEWIEADVNESSLCLVKGNLDCVIHCAGGSSVGKSIVHPRREFKRTVESTIHVLEYLRTYHPGTTLIYPSSAAVYGDKPDIPISEDSRIAPVSPYGFYKKIVEDLCESYTRNFDISASIIRFFSIYGTGLQKQLLWDGCTKLCSGKKETKFYGTGDETRDWLHVKDAAKLIYRLSHLQKGCEVFNGGSGRRVTVMEILSMLVDELQVPSEICMGRENKLGDPKHYWSDQKKTQQLGWEPLYKLEDGLREYVQWFLTHQRMA